MATDLAPLEAPLRERSFSACGEGFSYRREAVVNARVLYRPCAGEGYYRTS